MNAGAARIADPLASDMQELIAEIGRLRIRNERLSQCNFILTRRLRAANTARSVLRRRMRELA